MVTQGQIVRGDPVKKPLFGVDKIPSISIFLTSKKEDMLTFYDNKGNVKFKEEEDNNNNSEQGPKKSFFFGRNNSSFISFKHSVGFSDAGNTNIEIKLIDPGRDFEVTFLDATIYEKNVNKTVRPIYVAYGMGEDLDNWSRPILANLIMVDIDVTSKGARIITLYITGVNSLVRLSKENEERPYADLDQTLGVGGTIAFAAENFGEVSKGKSALERNPGTGSIAGGLGAGTTGSMFAKKKGPKTGGGQVGYAQYDETMKFLDEAIFQCTQRYLENISQHKGNVIILLPSINFSSLKGKWMALDKARTTDYGHVHDQHFAIIESLNNLLNDYGFHAGSLMKHEDTTHDFGWHSRLTGNKNQAVKRGKEFQKARKDIPIMLTFQANSNDIKKGKDSDAVDWQAPLRRFGDSYLRTIKNVAGVEKYLAGSPLGSSVYREIDDPRVKDLLFKKGIIKNPNNNCSVWGAEKLVDLFLHGYSKDTKPPSKDIGFTTKEDITKERAKKKDHYMSTLIEGETSLNSTAGAILAAMNDIEFTDEIAKAQGKGSLYNIDIDNIIEGMESLIDGNNTANYIDFNTGRLLPIFRANVSNSNVMELQVKENPVYWQLLSNVVNVPIVKTKIEEVQTLTELQKHHNTLKKDKRVQKILKTTNFPEGSTQKSALAEMIKKILPNLLENKKEENLVLQDLIKSFLSSSEDVFSPISSDRFAHNLFDFKQLLYNQLFQFVHQVDIVSIPMFTYSSMSELSKPVFLYAAQPTILGDFDGNTIDKMALQSSEDVEKEKKYYSSFFSGFYIIGAFEHTITKSRAESHFRLIKSVESVTNQERDGHMGRSEGTGKGTGSSPITAGISWFDPSLWKKGKEAGLPQSGKETIPQSESKNEQADLLWQTLQDLNNMDDDEYEVQPTTSNPQEGPLASEGVLTPKNKVENEKVNLTELLPNYPSPAASTGEIDWSNPENMPPEIAGLKPKPMNNNVIPIGESEPRTDITLEEEEKLKKYASEQRRIKQTSTVLENNRHLNMEHLTKSEVAELINESARAGFNVREQAELLWEKNAINQRGNPTSNNLQSQYENSPFGGSPKHRTKWSEPFGGSK